MFTWHAEGCRFLPVAAAAEVFRAAQLAAASRARRSGSRARGGHGDAGEGGGGGEGEGGLATCDAVVDRILIAGTSRSRGLAYALAAALSAAEGAPQLMAPREKKASCNMLSGAGASSGYPALPQVLHYHLHGR